MAIERLRVKGFKSFGAQCDFDFAHRAEGGFTAIVGPNGSGKSNVLDALRYVLGESSPSLLRITRLSDLLFQGSATMTPAKEAEVSLFLGGVNLKRHYDAESGSVYSVNGARVRLQDIEEIKTRFHLSGDEFAFIGQGTVAEVIHQRPRERRSHLEVLFGIDKYRKKRDDTFEKLKTAETEMQRIQTLIQELNSRREEIAPEVEVAVEAQGILDNLENLRRDYYFSKRLANEKKISDLEVQLTISVENRDALKNWARAWNSCLEATESRYGALLDEEQALVANERALADKKDSLLRSCYAAASNLRANIFRKNALLKEDKRVDETLQNTVEETNIPDIEELNAVIKTLSELEERERKISASFTDAFASSRKNAALVNQSRREISELEAQLENLKESSESEYPAPERMLLSASRLSKIKAKIEIVAEVFSFQNNYSRIAPAVEVYLGRRRFYLLVHTMQEAQEGIEHLKGRGAGRATFLPLERTRPRSGDARFVARHSGDGIVGWAGELITVKSPWEPALAHLLGDLLIVENYERGATLVRKGASFPIATVGGDIFSPAGTVSGGSPANRSRGSHHEKILMIERDIGDKKNLLANLQEDFSEAEKLEQKLAGDRTKLSADLANKRAELTKIERNHARLSGRAEQEKMSARERRAKIASELEELTILDRKEHEKLKSLGKNYYDMWLELKALREKIAGRHEATKKFVARSKRVKARCDKAGENVRRGFEAGNTIEEKMRASRAEISQLSELWDEKYPYNKGEALSLEIEKDLIQVMRRLERELKALGAYNLGALSEDESLLERTDFLSEQLEDARTARDELDLLIKQTDQQVEKLFTEALANIDKRFNELFTRLFGGGEARLALQDGETIWDRGVEIFARPPGKQLHNIAQLSGGEQSLTAIAHLFASLEVAGVPIAVLDEVDASLDEYNLIRFANLAKEYSNTIQIFAMTHRRTTMERADLIYGVTMVEPGLSRIVGINLDEWGR